MFDSSIRYSRAAQVLQENGGFLKYPMQVQLLRSFAMELITKAIYYKINGTEWDYTHFFVNIFDKLDKGHKDWLENEFKNQVKKMGKDPLEKHLRKMGETVPIGLRGHLEKWSPIFKNLRYPDCENKKIYIMLYFDQIMNSFIRFYESGIEELHDGKPI